MLEPIHTFLDKTKHLSVETFLETYANPVLVVEPFKLDMSAGFTTINCEKGDGSIATIGFLVKRKDVDANPFTNMITIGRAINNDLVLPSGNISKFHAYVNVTSSGVYLTDAKSTYGTYVSGKQLPPKEKHLLRSSESLRFGNINCLFLTPICFYDYLRQVMDVAVSSRG